MPLSSMITTTWIHRGIHQHQPPSKAQVRGNYDSSIGHFPNRKTETIWIQGRTSLSFQHEKVSKSAFHCIQGSFTLPMKEGCGLTNQVGQDFWIRSWAKDYYFPTPVWGTGIIKFLLWASPNWYHENEGGRAGCYPPKLPQPSHSEHVQSLLSLLTYPS